MKAWSDDHPKARLLARKRKAIIGAARDAFLRVGYEGASMESIAAAAGVSITTLYRHAQSKDQLFASVVLSACEYAHDAEDADGISLVQPIEAVLVQVGDRFQDRLTSRDTISLFRTVMVETARFPHLAEAAYRGLVEAWEVQLDRFLSSKAEFQQISAATRRGLVATFVGDLVGTGTLRALFGLHVAPVEERTQRSKAAAEKLLANLRL